MPDRLTIPTSIEAVIAEFDARDDGYDCAVVHSALCAARASLERPTPQEDAGAWSEVLAFGVTGTEHYEKPWGTHFGPMGSGTRSNGEPVYFPDATQADVAVFSHWKARSTVVKAPVLVARYNDLVWDFANLIGKEKPDVSSARKAIRAYIALATQNGRDVHDVFDEAERALTLAIQIGDQTHRDAARAALLALHRREMCKDGMWWKAWDTLERQPKSGLTTQERDTLVADLEAALLQSANSEESQKFNPHSVESAANKLIAHYRRKSQLGDVQRLHLKVAKAFEHFGNMASPMVASTVLHTSMDAYTQAGMRSEAERILRKIEEANVASVADMQRFEHTETVPAKAVEEFLNSVLGETKDATFLLIAIEFMPKRSQLLESLHKTATSAPLLAALGQTQLKGDRVVAELGSIEEDPTGRLIDHANHSLSVTTPWLSWAVERARERHSLSADDLTEWANRTLLFGDGRLLHEGLVAWLAEDHIKAAHILVPQVEAGFRALIGRCGRPTTKPHPQMSQARMVLTMSETLFHKETAPALGPNGDDIVILFLALYADQRGRNLRNDIAHGLVSIEGLNAGTLLWVVHSLLLLGAWLKPS